MPVPREPYEREIAAIVGVIGEPENKAASNSVPRPTFQLINDVELESLPDLEWQVGGVLPRGGLAMLYGKSGAYKSFLALHIACCIRLGLACLGHPAEPGRVVYVIGEGTSGMRKRITAWKSHYGFTGRSIDMQFVNGPVNLLNAGQVAHFRELLGELSADTPVRLVVFDTLQRCMGGGSDSEQKDMSQAVAAIDRIREVGPAALVVHHTGWNEERERGAYLLRASSDVVIRVTSSGLTVKLENEKQKDLEPFIPIERQLVKASQSLAIGITGADTNPPSGISQNSWKVLESLSRDFLPDGARYKEWQVASGVPVGSFARARTEVVSNGYVERSKIGTADVYAMTPDGRTALAIRIKSTITPLSDPLIPVLPPRYHTTLSLQETGCDTGPRDSGDSGEQETAEETADRAAEIDERLGIQDDDA